MEVCETEEEVRWEGDEVVGVKEDVLERGHVGEGRESAGEGVALEREGLKMGELVEFRWEGAGEGGGDEVDGGDEGVGGVAVDVGPLAEGGGGGPAGGR